MKLVFATNNLHKLAELQKMLDTRFELVSLDQIGCTDDIAETGETLEENASQKAHFIYEKYGLNCFADDTGLEVEALNNQPGVYSARYAGPQRNAGDNMRKLLLELNEIKNRNARFRTVISLIINGEEMLFEGVVEGTITRQLSGIEGFGYDPIFQPNGYQITFAEMEMDTKNQISHRGRAVSKLMEHLKGI